MDPGRKGYAEGLCRNPGVKGAAGTRHGAGGSDSALAHAPAWTSGRSMALGLSVPPGVRDVQVSFFLILRGSVEGVARAVMRAVWQALDRTGWWTVFSPGRAGSTGWNMRWRWGGGLSRWEVGPELPCV